MNAIEFAKKVIEGPGGLNDFEYYEMATFKESDRVMGAYWMLRCLANPKCEGSELAIQAILEKRAAAAKERGPRPASRSKTQPQAKQRANRP